MVEFKHMGQVRMLEGVKNGWCPEWWKNYFPIISFITSVNIEDVKIHADSGRTWNGISYVCPLCNTVINVQIDPIAIKADTVNEILKGLGK